MIQCKSCGFLIDEWRRLEKTGDTHFDLLTVQDTVTVKLTDSMNEHGPFSDSS